MKPRIDSTSFGSITIASVEYEHDVTIGLDHAVKKRQKKLSKAVYGTSHIVSLAEAQHVYESGAMQLIIGNGQNGVLRLSPEADSYFKERGCAVILLPTPQAIVAWNQAQGKVIGLFHITC